MEQEEVKHLIMHMDFLIYTNGTGRGKTFEITFDNARGTFYAQVEHLIYECGTGRGIIFDTSQLMCSFLATCFHSSHMF